MAPFGKADGRAWRVSLAIGMKRHYRTMTAIAAAAFLAFCQIFFPLSLSAGNIGDAYGDVSSVSLIAASEGIAPGQKRVLAGLRITLGPGWKTYWRAPGDAGFALSAKWTDNDNIRDITIEWPAPRRYSEYGLETIGYEKDVTLPVKLTLADPGRAATIGATVDYLVCKDVCIPKSAPVFLSLPALAAPMPSPMAPIIEAALDRVPPMASDDLRIEKALWQADGVLEIDVSSTTAMGSLDAFIEDAGDISFPAPQIRFMHDGYRALLRFQARKPVQSSPLGRVIRVTVVDMPGQADRSDLDADRLQSVAWRSASDMVTVTGTPVRGGGGFHPTMTFSGILWMMLLAVIGGLILNVMPCVLPVLSLKLMTVVNAQQRKGQREGQRERPRDRQEEKDGGDEKACEGEKAARPAMHSGGVAIWTKSLFSRGEKAARPAIHSDAVAIRTKFLFSVAGILVSFMLLALALIVFRAAGYAVGWGFHFQSPVFLALMGAMMTIFASSIILDAPLHLPGWLSQRLSRHPADGNDRHGGAFIQGMFAVALATPCSAPVIGTVAGFALSRGAIDILLIFQAMAWGFALPWLVIAAFPRLIFLLPKPGRWMRAIQWGLAVALLLTVVWLIFVIIAQRGGGVAAVVALGCVFLFFLPVLVRRYVYALMIAIVVAIGAVPFVHDGAQDGQKRVAAAGIWSPLDPERIPILVDQGRVVLVDVTADWCITCQINHLLVLDRDATRRMLDDFNVVAMRGDWTLPDDQIAAFLAGFQRYGVPFNAVYGPGAKDGIVLSEILDQDDLHAALVAASRPK